MNQKLIENLMRYCLHLGRQGIGSVSPNPPVGAIVVYNDKIIGQGYHRAYGESHAEVNALNNVKPEDQKFINESTLFVSLEPCNHQGKTPPCTEVILKSGIKKLVFGCNDPNPIMSGKSIELLKQHKLDITGPILEGKCRELIRAFSTNIVYKRPYILLKFAQSADFFLGKRNQQTKITSQIADILVHKWRAESDGILIGANTLKTDNPELTTRYWPGKSPVKIILGKIPLEEKIRYKVFDGASPALLSTEIMDGNPPELAFLLTELLRRKIGILLVEGGAKTLSSFIESGLWDEARIITREDLKLGEGLPAPSLSGKLTKKLILNKEVIHYIAKNQQD